MISLKRLTYEEKMARRLLGPQNAAAVFQAQNDSEAQDSPQVNYNNLYLNGVFFFHVIYKCVFPNPHKYSLKQKSITSMLH